ncbi:MAG: protein-L-isoaspartate O-methyltransferase [Pseudomonadota bacterium]
MSDPFRAAKLLLELRQQGVTDDGVLKAIETVSRADFTPPDTADLAFEDCALPIGCGQTLYSPMVAGQLLQALQLTPNHSQSVFVIGAGSGYTMALAGQMAKSVSGIDRYFSLLETASRALSKAAAGAIYEFYHGDGLNGLASSILFDRILLAGTTDRVPDALSRMLKPGGRIVTPLRETNGTVLRSLDSNGQSSDWPLHQTISPLVPGPARRL